MPQLRNFDPVIPEDPMAKACSVVEITPVSISGKADLIQKVPEEVRRESVADLAARGMPGDIEAVKAMGFELDGDSDLGWSIKD